MAQARAMQTVSLRKRRLSMPNFLKAGRSPLQPKDIKTDPHCQSILLKTFQACCAQASIRACILCTHA